MGKKRGHFVSKLLSPMAKTARDTIERIGSILGRGSAAWTLVSDPEIQIRGLGPNRIFRMRIAAENAVVPDFRPGQYVLLSFPGRGVLSSPRAFTIASPPSNSNFLEFFIKDSGPWTGAAKMLVESVSRGSGNVMAHAYVSEVRGKFSYLSSPGTGRFVFLAGGIGGAPFLSMIRFMADADRERRVLFMWGARTRDDIFGGGELSRAAERLPLFRFVPVLSHDPLWTGERGRIDQEKLERLVPAFFGSSKVDFEWNSASYWLCGPPAFRRDMRKILRGLGVRGVALHEERFRQEVFKSKTLGTSHPE